MKQFVLALLGLSPLWLSAKPSSESSLPLFMGQKVIGITIGLGSDNPYSYDMYWRTRVEFVNSAGKKDCCIISPSDDKYYNESARKYCMDNLADIPIYPKTKIDSVNGEEVRQLWLARKAEAIQIREKKAKEAEIRLAKAVTMYSRLNALFGYKIGTVFDVSKLGEVKASAPAPMRGIWFTPDKQFLTFDKYSLGITPVSHRIFSITASAPYSKQTLELAKGALERKFSDTLRYDDVRNEYSTFGLNAKKNMRSLTLGKEGDRLMLRLLDAKGLEVSKNEYEQQKDKVSSEAANAL